MARLRQRPAPAATPPAALPSSFLSHFLTSMTSERVSLNCGHPPAGTRGLVALLTLDHRPAADRLAWACLSVELDAGGEMPSAGVTLQLTAAVRARMQQVAHAQAARTRHDPLTRAGGVRGRRATPATHSVTCMSASRWAVGVAGGMTRRGATLVPLCR